MQSSRSVKSNTIRRNSVSSARALKDIPRVQIFLDSQLNKAITKIKQESAFKNPQISDPYRKMSVQQPPQQSFKPSSSVRRQSASNIAPVSKTITLMPNDVVLNYIKEVYQKYGIKNPFEGYLDESSNIKEKEVFTFEKYPSFSDRKQRPQQQQEVEQSIKTHKKQRKISQNQARIFQLKNKFKQTIQNQPFLQENTIKKILPKEIQQTSEQNSVYEVDFIKKSQGNITYIDRLTNLMQSRLHDTYDFENDTTLNKTGTNEQTPQRSLKHINKFYEETSHEGITDSPQVMKPKKKLFVKTRTTSIKYHQKQSTPQNQKHLRVTFKDFELYPKQNYFEGQHTKPTSIIKIQESPSYVTSQIIENHSRYFESKEQIPQIYRYCLGCQSPILNSNIAFHQGKCLPLRQLSNLSLDQLYSTVQNKLNRLKQEIAQSDLMNLDQKDIRQIKQQASIILKPSQGQIKDSDKRYNFAKISSILSTKLLTGCQLIKKLEWFTKLQQNLHQHLATLKQAQMSPPFQTKYQTR